MHAMHTHQLKSVARLLLTALCSSWGRLQRKESVGGSAPPKCRRAYMCVLVRCAVRASSPDLWMCAHLMLAS